MPTADDSTSEQGQAASSLGEFVLATYQDFYHGKKALIDKLNRNRQDFLGEFRAIWKAGEGEDWRSRATPRIVGQKVRTAFYLLMDVALQDGRLPFGFVPSRQLLAYDPDADDTFRQVLEDADDIVRGQMDMGNIETTFLDCLMSLCLNGLTYSKEIYTSSVVSDFQQVGDTWESRRVRHFHPAIEYVSPWEAFGDPEFGFDPHKGRGFIHSKPVSARWLRAQIGKPLWIADGIRAAIADVRRNVSTNDDGSDDERRPALRAVEAGKCGIKFREAWLWVPRRYVVEFTAAAGLPDGETQPGATLRPDEEDSGDDLYCMVSMAGRHVVRFAGPGQVQPEDNPYDMAVMERQADEQLPVGTADMAQQAHERIAGCIRLFEDNKAWACNVQAFIRRYMIEKMPKAMKPGGLWDLKAEGNFPAGDAFAQLIIQDVGETLLSMLAIWEKYADWESMLPKISQGQIEKNQTTATEINEQARRSDAYVSGILRNVDGMVESWADRFHRENMLDQTIRRGKGDFKAKSRGYQAHQDRVARYSAYQQLFTLLAQDPAFVQEITGMMKAKGVMVPFLKSMRIDPDGVMKSPQEQEQHAMQMADAAAAEQQPAAALPAPVDPLAGEKTAAEIDKLRADAAATLDRAEAEMATVELRARELDQQSAVLTATGPT